MRGGEKSGEVRVEGGREVRGGERDGKVRGGGGGWRGERCGRKVCMRRDNNQMVLDSPVFWPQCMLCPL